MQGLLHSFCADFNQTAPFKGYDIDQERKIFEQTNQSLMDKDTKILTPANEGLKSRKSKSRLKDKTYLITNQELQMSLRRWASYRPRIIEKYVVEKKPLKTIMMDMEEEEGFSASKSEYERQLRAWGCRKNGNPDIWKFVSQRLKERDAQGKRSDVYLHGNLIDNVVVQRQTARAYFTSIELHTIARPTTPDNVAIIPPVSLLYLDAIKSNQLPWQHFCYLIGLQASLNITIQLPNDMRQTMIPYLAPGLKHSDDIAKITKRIVEYVGNILPLNHDEEVYGQLQVIFADTSQHSTWEFLKLTVYLLSNKLLVTDPLERFPSGVKMISKEVLKWLQMGNNVMFLRAILSIKTPSIDAFVEPIFCRAIEDGDRSMARIFLESGTDPNTFVEDNYTGDVCTPLQLAIATENVEMAKLLLEYGADTSAKDERVQEYGRYYPPYLQTPLQIAARVGNLELVILLLSAGAKVNTDKRFFSSALQNAAQGQHYELVQLLLAAKADINTCFGRYGCALECAIRNRSLRLTNLLLDHGADVNATGKYCITPLQSAVMVNDEKMVSYLLKQGAKVNTPAAIYFFITDRLNPLQWAVKNGNMSIVSLLLDHGADVNGVPSELARGTPLTVAVQERNYGMVEHLLHAGANVNDYRGRETALEVAIEKRDDKMISILLEAGADPREDTSLSLAAEAFNVELLSTLLEKGADINKFNKDVPTALYQAVMARNCELVKFLLLRGADPNLCVTDYHWCPILHIPTKWKNLEIIDVLIQAGADCNRAFNSEAVLNPLQTAASDGDLELVEYFIVLNADVNWPAMGYNGRTALQAAVENGHMHIVEFLLENNADINAPAGSQHGATALQVAISQQNYDLADFLLDNGASADDQPSKEDGLSALQMAAGTGNNDLVLKLVQAGAKVNGPAVDEGGFYAIQIAARNGHIQTVELLLQLGADVNAPASLQRGYTALQAAVSKGHLRIVELLLERGADVNARGYYVINTFPDGTALVAAAYKGYLRIAKLLLAGGAKLIVQGTRPALTAAASEGRIDMIKLLITEAVKDPEFNNDHLDEAVRMANFGGHTAAAKFLECHKVIMGSSCRLGIQGQY